MMSFAQLAVERVANSLPEGLLIALCAWLLLRVMGRQNAGTRFAVWLVALAGVVALPLLGALRVQHAGPTAPVHAPLTVPSLWAEGFFVLWIALAALGLARVAAGIWQVRQIRGNCREVPLAEIGPALQALLAESRRPVRLLASDHARVPAALGFRKPAVVLPAWTLRDLSARELEPILIHELAHLRRHDDWTNLLQKAVRAILFFHPAVWWIDVRLSLEREMACDDAVIAATGNPRAYAGCLIDLLEKGCALRGWTMAQAAVARVRDASVRIARILEVGTSATTRVGRGALGLAASLSLTCAGMVFCTPRLVEFVPMHQDSATLVAKPGTFDDGIRLPRSGVVAASFHPAEKAPFVGHAPRRRIASHETPIRQIAAPEPRRTMNHAMNHVKLAEFESPAGMNPGMDPGIDPSMPTLVVFETREASTSSQQPVELRRVGVQQLGAGVQQQQNREDPALQIQIFQVIDPATGNPMQILRIVFVLPAGSDSSQSI